MAICKQFLPLLLALRDLAQEKSGVPAKKGEKIKVIRAGTLIDGSSAQPRHNQIIVIRGNRIEKVLPEQAAEAVPGGPGVEIIDLSRATVLPGLIDSHTHIFLQGEDPAEGGYDVQLLKYGLAYRPPPAPCSPPPALDQGFTPIRD